LKDFTRAIRSFVTVVGNASGQKITSQQTFPAPAILFRMRLWNRKIPVCGQTDKCNQFFEGSLVLFIFFVCRRNSRLNSRLNCKYS